MDFQSVASIENLKRRAALLSTARRFFDERGFVEVQTPVLSRDTIIDRHLDPIEVPMQLPGNPSTNWYLQTSPEQSMKRLLASGAGSIYQIGPVFRAFEKGPLHNPEFTMLEWYEVGAGLEQGLQLLDRLLQSLLKIHMTKRVRFEHAFQAATNLDLFGSSTSALARWCVARGLVDRESWSDDWDDWVNLIFSECVQSTLGHDEAVLVTHFPVSQAALACVCQDDPRVAERYEAFYHGVELANGYHELLDADQLLARAIMANEQRIRDGKKALPLQNRVLDAMRAGIPSSCGCALGFDRVAMLACGETEVERVMAFTADNA
jgi:elongation factor P--(R)-beta-lysine ligase